MRARYFYGWNVVGATFVMALFSFGLGFYAMTVYVAMLQRLHGWSASVVSLPVTVYYVAGALLTAVAGALYERFGPRIVVASGSVAMAVGVSALGLVTQPWQLYPVFLVMSLGWGSMSGAAINIIVAPWFQRRRGLVVSIAFNGATLGGVIIAPALISLIDAVGFTLAVEIAAVALLLVLIAVAAGVMRSGPEDLGVGPDGDPVRPTRAGPSRSGDGRWRREAIRTWRFWSVSTPFALGLAAQVGVLTHLVALVTPALGAAGAAPAVSATTAAALIGRSVTGVVVDRLNRRLVSTATLLVQMMGLALLAWASSPTGVYAGCALFGVGVGNLVTLPGLILAVEWPRERFSALVSLVVGINQFTFAFGPSLVGLIRDWAGTYGAALGACIALQATAAVLVMLGPGRAAVKESDMSDVAWRSFKVDPSTGEWEPGNYNVKWEDGREYGRWRRVLRKDAHGLTVISRYTAPPGKAWKIIGKASALGEEVYIMGGAYYNNAGRIVAGPGTFMFNAPGAIHGGISCGLTLYIHCCSGEPDEIVSIELIDFEPQERVASAHA